MQKVHTFQGYSILKFFYKIIKTYYFTSIHRSLIFQIIAFVFVKAITLKVIIQFLMIQLDLF